LFARGGVERIRVATGWPQGEAILHQSIRFGLVSRLVKRQPAGADPGASAAAKAFAAKAALVQLARPLVDGVLRLLGDTGHDIYMLGQRTGRTR
jgi:hypothetical protein